MMTANLIKRLRKHAGRGYSLGAEAADEIERLRARADKADLTEYHLRVQADAQRDALTEEAALWKERAQNLGWRNRGAAT